MSFSKRNDKSCVQCCKKKSSYKCPKCLSPYCSAACYKEHISSCSVAVIEPLVLPKLPVVENDKDTKDQIKSAENSSSCGDVEILSEETKNKLKQSGELRRFLKSKKLQKKIRDIDMDVVTDNSNRNKRKYNGNNDSRQERLKRARSQNPEFEQFLSLLLSIVK